MSASPDPGACDRSCGRRRRTPPPPPKLILMVLLLGLAAVRRCASLSFHPTKIARHQSPYQRASAIAAGAVAGTGVVRLSSTALRSSPTDVAVDLRHVEFTKVDDASTMEGEPVIVLHGLLGNKKNFSSLGKSLAGQLKKRRRVMAVDLRNHGENHHDWREEMSYSAMADDVLGFMDRQQCDKAIIVGHSMGGKVAKALALMHPDRVSGLVVLDIAPVRYTAEEDVSWKAVQSIVDALVTVDLTPGKTKQEVDKELRSSVEDPALRAFVLTNLDQQRGSEEPQLKWKINLDSISRQLDTIAGFDVHHRDASMPPLDDVNGDSVGNRIQYEGDTFIIHGGASRFVRHSHMKAIAAYFPNHMLTTIRGAGHWVHAERPDDTLALLKRYLDR